MARICRGVRCISNGDRFPFITTQDIPRVDESCDGLVGKFVFENYETWGFG